ncbi:cell division protein FtsZ [Desulfobacter hydrogenophilus]|uniref:Cell division protein FtsZ n=1 Tax=Desulfobacter hydrogenophilus TaxID=2291 RepID=A0A328FFQ7_9BACT|nr:cell division protein FtsZ [Desulfobacter hydrogenophilus]NDY73578.1 cell division protein FtsZ [Desulfobacter hydrogenophilus]QBH13671.1 cell division protein FtsZ [Desulfobacter hydrogenophilus]RAM01857.1 cell division protein FtsZ [Desulfobacter hydrogenophilus]
MTFSYVENNNTAKIKVIGVGGAGGNAVNNMIDAKLQGVKFIVANTDAQALEHSRAETKIQMGVQLTEGLGAGADPSVGRDAALESMDELRESLADSHMVFITAGFGGGTGTGAAPVIAEICKDLGILTVAVASKPFSFEGKKRERAALDGLEKLQEITDTVITIPNDRLRGIAGKGARMKDMFIKADEILHHSVKGITDLIMMPGHVNLDFADVKTTMQKAGKALMGIGIASGENRATEAAERAISHPLLEDISVSGAKGVLMNITSSSDLTLDEMTEACDRIYQEVGDDAEIIWGQTFDEELGDEIRITVIATGIGMEEPAFAENMRRFDPQTAQAYGQQPQQTRAANGTYGAYRTQSYGQNTSNMGQSPSACRQDPIARGVVRDATEEDMANWEEPVRVVRHKRVVGDDNQTQDYGMNYDNDDLEIPTFLRRKAD